MSSDPPHMKLSLSEKTPVSLEADENAIFNHAPCMEQCSTEENSVLPETNADTIKNDVSLVELSSIEGKLNKPNKNSQEAGNNVLIDCKSSKTSNPRKEIIKPNILKKQKSKFQVPKLIKDTKPIQELESAKHISTEIKIEESNSNGINNFSISKPIIKTNRTRKMIQKKEKTSFNTPKSLSKNKTEEERNTSSKEISTMPSPDKTVKTTKSSKTKSVKSPKKESQPRQNKKPNSSKKEGKFHKSDNNFGSTNINRNPNSSTDVYKERSLYTVSLTMPDISRFHPQLEDAKKRYIEKQQKASSSVENSAFSFDPTSVGVSKMNINVEIDPNINDEYTALRHLSTIFRAQNNDDPNESPERKRKRVEAENMVVARQCRLHPANRSLNQGEVVNPPLMNPPLMIGYTPAGQRYQCDLNCDRPTWFNSEYARCQFDHATKINACRMFSDLESGYFLPLALDPHLERIYKAERKLAVKYTEEHFNTTRADSASSTPLPGPHSWRDRLLETERRLVELNKFAVVRFMDFPLQLKQKLEDATKWNLTRLMFYKNPSIILTIEKISQQNIFEELKSPAQNLLMKIKGMFDVSEAQTFYQYFTSKVEEFLAKVEDLSGVAAMLLVEEPTFTEAECTNSGYVSHQPDDEEINSPLRLSDENVSDTSPSKDSQKVFDDLESLDDKDAELKSEDSEWVPLLNPNGEREYELTARARDINEDTPDVDVGRRRFIESVLGEEISIDGTMQVRDVNEDSTGIDSDDELAILLYAFLGLETQSDDVQSVLSRTFDDAFSGLEFLRSYGSEEIDFLSDDEFDEFLGSSEPQEDSDSLITVDISIVFILTINEYI